MSIQADYHMAYRLLRRHWEDNSWTLAFLPLDPQAIGRAVQSLAMRTLRDPLCRDWGDYFAGKLRDKQLDASLRLDPPHAWVRILGKDYLADIEAIRKLMETERESNDPA
jgi:hypothetical protein